MPNVAVLTSILTAKLLGSAEAEAQVNPFQSFRFLLVFSAIKLTLSTALAAWSVLSGFHFRFKHCLSVLWMSSLTPGSVRSVLFRLQIPEDFTEMVLA